MKKLLILAILLAVTFSVSAQQKAIQSITIQTNGSCEQCKKRMMEQAPTWTGVKECSYDAKTAKLTIKYDDSKTTPDKLRTNVSNLGYDADNVKANAEARAKLPACCTKPKSADGCNGDHSKGGCGGCGHHH